MNYESIQQYANELVALINPCCSRIKIAGSIRRKKPECKDIELVVIPDKWKLEVFLKGLKRQGRIIFKKNGMSYKQFSWKSIQVDLFIAKPDNWGWIYLLRTGSDKFNQELLRSYRRLYSFPRDIDPVTKGYIVKTSVDGYLRDIQGNKISTPEEQDVFDLFKMNFVEPENRE